MRYLIASVFSFLWFIIAWCDNSVDPLNPIAIDGCTITYNGEAINLSERCIYVDGSLSDDEAKACPWIFNDFNEAMANLTDGTEEEPMQVFIAPWVYWIDDPDDDTVRVGKDGREPIGLSVRCENLHLTGLNPNPMNVVLAAARGQTQGAVGNFTMIEFWGNGLEVRNLTMGNYCNVDLEYPLNPDLSRPKRMSAITQAHVAYAHGDKIFAENVRFISRLNMNPLSGGLRTLFNKCHFEMTDDALAASGVYLDCSLDYYGARPFWGTHPNGAVLLNCDINMCNNNDEVFFCKGVGQVTAVDSRINSKRPLYFGWTKYPPLWLRCYEYNVSLNGNAYCVGNQNPINTVELNDMPLLNAYKVTDGDKVVYNTYNLLCGNDEWDPLNVRDKCVNYDDIATSLIVSPRQTTITTGENTASLTAEAFRHCGYPIDTEVSWSIISDEPSIAQISHDGNTCTVTGANETDEPKVILVQANAPTGLQGAAVITIMPSTLPVPTFTTYPTMSICNGEAKIKYTFEANNSRDCSQIKWMRVVDNDTVPIAVSRNDKPKTTYKLTHADLGHTLIAEIRPKNARSELGSKHEVSLFIDGDTEIAPSDFLIDIDFSDFPIDPQPKIVEGAWTVDCYKPKDTEPYDWTPEISKPAWEYANGYNGAKGMGLLQCQRGARLMYTPESGEYGDMELWLDVDPTKTGGQGFGSATGQYMDIYIKFDTKSLTGYALRIERTTKYSNAVDFTLVRYDNGVVSPLTQPISSVCYRTGCHINLKAIGDTLSAKVYTDTPVTTNDPDLTTSVELETKIAPNQFGGVGIQHTGTCGENTTMLHRVRLK